MFERLIKVGEAFLKALFVVVSDFFNIFVFVSVMFFDFTADESVGAATVVLVVIVTFLEEELALTGAAREFCPRSALGCLR